MMNEPQIDDSWRGDWRTFTEPVIAADGYTYEKKAIEEWLKDHDTSPTTGEKLESTVLIPNLALRELSKQLNVNEEGQVTGTEITGEEDVLADPVTYESIESPNRSNIC